MPPIKCYQNEKILQIYRIFKLFRLNIDLNQARMKATKDQGKGEGTIGQRVMIPELNFIKAFRIRWLRHRYRRRRSEVRTLGLTKCIENFTKYTEF